MKKLYILVLITIAQWQAMGQLPYWQQEVHYTIDVSLNDREHTLDGFLKLRYINHSPDTLTYIWFHLWPNAFKNDRTAFTEQTLQNGKTDFYFSDREQRGYINRLDFRNGNLTLKTEDHPQYIDVIKVYLSAPLAPNQETEITTPFHVKLPANFSRGGHTRHSYQVTQWYPKPAVYDRLGWHPMPYLDQGEFYSEFGSFDVRITVPEGYVVAATGELQNEEEKKWLLERVDAGSKKLEVRSKKKPVNRRPPVRKKPVAHKPVQKKGGLKTKQPVTDEASFVNNTTAPAKPTKTLRYTQDNVHDFAWFADSAFKVLHDTIQLASGRVVQAYSFFRSKNDSAWNKSLSYIKDAVHFRSDLIGEYPFNTVSTVEAKMGFEGGMEYPTITSISPGMSERELDMTIEHEIGHNWFYGILASNERDHPWMDEGINTYYDNRYKSFKYLTDQYPQWLQRKLPQNPDEWSVDLLAKIKKDQPVSLPSDSFTMLNYAVMVYLKTGILLKHLETRIGTRRFDSCMRVYYRQWQFKHPYPDDFRQSMETCSGNSLQPFFDSLQHTGPVSDFHQHRVVKPAFLFSFKDYNKVNYIYWMPVAGYNLYDHFMIGALFHNYTFPAHKFQFMVAPLYATGSKQVNGVGHVSYSLRPDAGLFDKIEPGVGVARFSTNSNVDTNGHTIYEGYYRIAPSLRFYFRHALTSHVVSWLDFRTFFIGEQSYNRYASINGDPHPISTIMQTRYLNQVTFSEQNNRALYPYDYQLQVQQAKNFYRVNFTSNYYMNYAKGGGMQVRLFAAKFGYIGTRDYFGTYRYQPKLMAEQGSDDYTYSNYFIGRSENEGLASQQVMIRDGGLKLRTEMFSVPPTRTENWVAAVNLNTTLPRGLFPIQLPVRIFMDAGTYAESWKKDAATSKFLYVAGLQLTLFKDLLNVYAPILYSKEFRDNLKTLPEENKFFKKISFSLDIHRFNIRKMTGDKIPF